MLYGTREGKEYKHALVRRRASLSWVIKQIFAPQTQTTFAFEEASSVLGDLLSYGWGNMKWLTHML